MGNVVIDFLPKSELNGLITDLQDSTIKDIGTNVTVNAAQAIGAGARVNISTGFSGDTVALQISNESSDTLDSVFVVQTGGAGILGNLFRYRSNGVDRLTLSAAGALASPGDITANNLIASLDVSGATLTLSGDATIGGSIAGQGNLSLNLSRAIGTGVRLEVRTGFSGDNFGLLIDNQSVDTSDSVFVTQSGPASTLGNLLRLRSDSVNRFTVTGTGNATLTGTLDVGANVTAVDMIATG